MDRRIFIGSLLGTAAISQSQNVSDLLMHVEEPDRNVSAFQHPRARVIRKDSETQKTLLSTMGYAATVRIDRRAGLVVKSFAVDGTCVGGAPPLTEYNSAANMKRLYEKEKEALTRLRRIGSRYIHAGMRFDDRKLEIITDFAGHDLLTQDLDFLSDRWAQQIVEMCHEYRQVGIFKQNVSLSHLIHDRGQLLAIDFKWWEPRRRDARIFEIKGNIRWLQQHHPTLAKDLLATMTDMRSFEELQEEYDRWFANLTVENSMWMNASSRDLMFTHGDGVRARIESASLKLFKAATAV